MKLLIGSKKLCAVRKCDRPPLSPC